MTSFCEAVAERQAAKPPRMGNAPYFEKMRRCSECNVPGAATVSNYVRAYLAVACLPDGLLSARSAMQEHLNQMLNPFDEEGPRRMVDDDDESFKSEDDTSESGNGWESQSDASDDDDDDEEDVWPRM